MRACSLFALLLVAPPAFTQAPPASRHDIATKAGVVVCVCPLAADVGADVLKTGGNAVDTAVAVAFAEAVTWPEAGNIGGGGFMLVWPGAGKEPAFIDYRETAPAAATKAMFADGKTTALSHQAAGVPGTVAGLHLAHGKFGTKSWKELVAPAVRLAADGFRVDGPLATRLNTVLADPKTTNAEFRRVYGKPGGGKWADGDTLTLPDLAKTLRAVADRGPAGFYAGDHAEFLAEEMKAGGGLITKADLAAYTAKERRPVRGTYRGYDVIAAPPPSSGGTATVEALNILENFDLKAKPRQAPETVHLIAESMRRAFADRARYLGDPDFATVPDRITTKQYAKELAAGIDLKHATKSETLTPEIDIRDTSDSTTHFSIIDAAGMAVANTYTLENSFGNRVVVRGGGYILNNEMTDFNTRPGITSRTGGIGTPANEIVPGKRMLSSMSPLMLAKDGKLALVTGSPGGRTIINTVLCVVINVVDYDMPARQAVDEPRMHHQWFPDRITLEGLKANPKLAADLRALGHTVTGSGQGDAHTIRIDAKTGVRTGAADKRLNGKAAGGF